MSSFFSLIWCVFSSQYKHLSRFIEEQHTVLFHEAVIVAREQLAPFTAVPGVLENFVCVPTVSVRPGWRVNLLQEAYSEEDAIAFVASRPQEYSTVEAFKLESVHRAADTARSMAARHAALAAAYDAMVPVLDNLCETANQLLSGHVAM